jgi:hypothetical protein
MSRTGLITIQLATPGRAPGADGQRLFFPKINKFVDRAPEPPNDAIDFCPPGYSINTKTHSGENKQSRRSKLMEGISKYAAVVQENWPRVRAAFGSTGRFLEALVANPKRIMLTSFVLAGFFSLVGASTLMWVMIGIAVMIILVTMLSSAGSVNHRSRRRR